ncbi:MAG: hypothetical protein J0J04_07825 [Microbacterium sp.]|uniref:hypothetical protein n=1 Tax=Microbacterium sp. TaxID=51671 RepID=UPI001ACDA129|nr:hypothetical protein [Microbacterium sp.]MBN9214707.1 hypothetical protein [Microbacterium sp.]
MSNLAELSAAATPGEWDCEVSDDSVEINAGTARTVWHEGGWGRPASSWATTDRIAERDTYGMEEDEADQVAADAEFIVALVNAYRSGTLTVHEDGVRVDG